MIRTQKAFKIGWHQLGMIEKQKKRDLTKLCVEVFFSFKKIKFSSTFGFFDPVLDVGRSMKGQLARRSGRFPTHFMFYAHKYAFDGGSIKYYKRSHVSPPFFQHQLAGRAFCQTAREHCKKELIYNDKEWTTQQMWFGTLPIMELGLLFFVFKIIILYRKNVLKLLTKVIWKSC